MTQPWGQKASTDLEQGCSCGQGWGEEDLAGIQVFKRAGCQQQEGVGQGGRTGTGKGGSLRAPGCHTCSQGACAVQRGHQHHD